jgi:hypothetical protein
MGPARLKSHAARRAHALEPQDRTGAAGAPLHQARVAAEKSEPQP